MKNKIPHPISATVLACILAAAGEDPRAAVLEMAMISSPVHGCASWLNTKML
ncbi:TPA: hypothetical protein G8N70_003152 [Salmonella enterica]|uniref:Uncharacterized protein n=1 Tax=Salmonella enterica TaxID=28901 RepID=A0A744CCT2_SALER|nr:hypothetical protein [Salmonella enterica]HAF4919998.1 hypothetical protein [Salmonella enterica]